MRNFQHSIIEIITLCKSVLMCLVLFEKFTNANVSLEKKLFDVKI